MSEKDENKLWEEYALSKGLPISIKDHELECKARHQELLKMCKKDYSDVQTHPLYWSTMKINSDLRNKYYNEYKLFCHTMVAQEAAVINSKSGSVQLLYKLSSYVMFWVILLLFILIKK